MDYSTRAFPVFHCVRSLLRFMCIESVILSNHLILCRPLILLPSVFPSIRVFSGVQEVPAEAAEEVEDLPVRHGLIPVL